MTHDFDGLLPPRRPAPPVPVRTTPQAIVATARTRRRRKAARLVSTGSALSLAFGAVVALRPAPGTHGIAPEQTATKPPAAVTSPASAPPVVAGIGSGPRRRVPAPGPGAEQGGGGGGGAGATTTAGAPPAGPPQAVQRSTRPTPPPPRDGDDPYTRVDRTLVRDPDPGNDCTMQANTSSTAARTPAVLCNRVTGPETVRPGQPVAWVFDVCAYGGQAQTVWFSGAAEAEMFITNDEQTEAVWESRRVGGGAAHEVVIPAGHCLRYTVHWDGGDHDEEPLDRASYWAVGRLIGYGGPTHLASTRFTVS